MVIIGLIFIGIALLIGLAFWSWNSWTSNDRDRIESGTCGADARWLHPTQ
jgi:hypothetical protein